MATILEDEFRITQNTSGYTGAAGTADVASDIATFVVPDATGFKIRPGDVFSLYLASSTPTEIASTSLIRLIHTDSNQVIERELANVSYTVLVEWANRNIIYTFGAETRLAPDEKLLIRTTANLAVALAHTRFQISCVRGTRSII